MRHARRLNAFRQFLLRSIAESKSEVLIGIKVQEPTSTLRVLVWDKVSLQEYKRAF